jgi:hypothetical protein
MSSSSPRNVIELEGVSKRFATPSAGVGKAAYAKALDSEKGIFNPTGIMPPDGPKTCLAVQNAFNDAVKGKSIDLSKTYTDAFVNAAVPRVGFTHAEPKRRRITATATAGRLNARTCLLEWLAPIIVE